MPILSPAELRIIKALRDGQGLKQIAADIGMKSGAVAQKLARLRVRLGYRTTEQMLCALIAENPRL